MAQDNDRNIVFNGLGTFTYTVPVAGPYFFEGHISLPTISAGSSPSSVLVTINKNGSPIYTGVAGNQGFRTTSICAATDTIAIILSSAAAVDNTLNAIKSTFAIGVGT